MNRRLILSKLQTLTADLQPSTSTSTDDLHSLQLALARALQSNPELLIQGNHLPQMGLPSEMSPELAGHLDGLLASTLPLPPTAAAPLVFRRESALHSDFLGASSPGWGAGMAPTQTFGPFVNELGVHVWFDFYAAVQLVQVFLKGASSPFLLLATTGTAAPSSTYTISGGSVWIASKLISDDPSLVEHYTGLKVTGGKLEFTEKVLLTSGQLVIQAGTQISVTLDLDQNKVPKASPDAGFDAQSAVIQLPKTVSLVSDGNGGSLVSSAASCTVFGTHLEFSFANKKPISFSQLAHILIPYSVTGDAESPDLFPVRESKSLLCTLKGEARIKPESGWLLPTLKLPADQLGKAAGTGALSIGLKEGLEVRWKGLKGGATRLLLPAILVEPGLVSVIDFFASNPLGKQKWQLWRNSPATHHSEASLSFGKLFPFLFVSGARGNESVSFFCGHRCALDRPVDANGKPFKIESSVAFGSITQTAKQFHAYLLDNDLLFDGNFNKPESFERCSLALRNAFFTSSTFDVST